MSEKIETGGPAFPCHADIIPSKDRDYAGMTLRQYAAIKLRVPSSGTDWLDEMIRQSLRDELAAKAMQAMVSAEFAESFRPSGWKDEAYKMADAMLEAREMKNGQD